MWPRHIELHRSRYPHGLRAAAALATWLALALSALPWALAGLLGVIVCRSLYRWWPVSPVAISVEPERLTLTLENRRWVTLTAPFRAVVHGHWLALHCPRLGWVWVFADQADVATLTPLRQVLWLHS